MINPTITSEGRFFINKDGPGCGNPFQYHNCIKLAGLEKSFGDITPIYCPNPNQTDDFIEIGTIKGADTRWTSTLSSKLSVNTPSILEDIAQQGCSFDGQVHYGQCARPNDFTGASTVIVLRNIRLTSYSLSDLIALTPEERAAVDESAAISVGDVYRVFNQTYTSVAQSLLTVQAVLDVTYCDNNTCGTACGKRSNGCKKAVALTQSAFLYTLDSGLNWLSTGIGTTTADNDEEQGAMTCAGSNIVFSTYEGTTPHLHVVPVDSIFAGAAVTTTVFSGTVSQSIRELVDAGTYVFGGGGNGNGFLIAYNKSNNTTTILEDGTLLSGVTGYALAAYDDNHVLFGGSGGNYIYSTNFGVFTAGQLSIGGVAQTDRITAFHMIDETNWLAATDSNRILCTNDSGANWNIVLATSGEGEFSFYDSIVGYFHDNAGIYRTLDSGNTWQLVYAFTSTDVNGIAVCPYNVNNVLAVGGQTAVAGTGYILRGAAV